jgi:hypothetical protein
MPENDWRGNENSLNELTDILSTYNVGEQQDYDYIEDLREDLRDLGTPDTWDADDIALVVNGEGEWALEVGGERWEVGDQEEFGMLYGFLQDWGIDAHDAIEYEEA